MSKSYTLHAFIATEYDKTHRDEKDRRHLVSGRLRCAPTAKSWTRPQRCPSTPGLGGRRAADQRRHDGCLTDKGREFNCEMKCIAAMLKKKRRKGSVSRKYVKVLHFWVRNFPWNYHITLWQWKAHCHEWLYFKLNWVNTVYDIITSMCTLRRILRCMAFWQWRIHIESHGKVAATQWDMSVQLETHEEAV